MTICNVNDVDYSHRVCFSIFFECSLPFLIAMFTALRLPLKSIGNVGSYLPTKNSTSKDLVMPTVEKVEGVYTNAH